MLILYRERKESNEIDKLREAIAELKGRLPCAHQCGVESHYHLDEANANNKGKN